MSALTPHIRVLRALALNIENQCEQHCKQDDNPAYDPASAVLARMAWACRDAANQLEAAEPSLPEDEHPITYDPKGKR